MMPIQQGQRAHGRDLLAEHEIALQRARIEFQAHMAQQLHDEAMGGPSITDSERMAYVCASIGFDRERIDACVRVQRALRG